MQATTHSRLIRRLLAALCGVVAIALFAAGAASLWADVVKTDAEGYFTSDSQVLDTPTHAVVSDGLEIDGSAGWALDHDIVRLRTTVAPSGDGKSVFAGIAPRDAVEAYLSGASYAKVTNVELDPLEIETISHSGAATPAAPIEQAFWTASVHGIGTQTLDWQPEPGDWALVVMNEDGSAGIQSRVAFGAELPHLFELGLGLTLVGGLVLTGALLLLWRRRPPAPAVHTGDAADPLPASGS